MHLLQSKSEAKFSRAFPGFPGPFGSTGVSSQRLLQDQIMLERYSRYCRTQPGRYMSRYEADHSHPIYMSFHGSVQALHGAVSKAVK